MKKKFSILIFMIGVVMMPSIVLAQSYYSLSNMSVNNNQVYSGGSYYDSYFMFYIGQAGTFKGTITTEKLDSSKTYTVTLKSDFINKSTDYTGEQLNNGVEISLDDAKSYITLTINEKGTSNLIKYKYESTCYPGSIDCVPQTYYLDESVLFFNNEIDSTDLDAFYNETFKDGVAYVKTIKLEDSYKLNSALTKSLGEYETERFSIMDETYESDDPTMISITDNNNRFHSKKYPITYKYAEINESKLKKVNEIIKQFDESLNNLEDKWFIIEDLENINFKYAVRNNTNSEKTINMAVNYSSKLHNLFGNNNITVAADTRMGWDSKITSGAGGYLNVMYDGVIYASINSQGTIQKNVIYVPDGTEKKREVYIETAKNRIKKYLPSANVEIEYAGQITDLSFDDLQTELENIVDIDKTLGEYYTLTLDNKKYTFFIAEGSKNMNEPFLKTKDLYTNVYVESSSSQVPLDSSISTKILDKDSEQYKNLCAKLKITDGISVDIKLFSNSQKAYVTKLDNGKFKVYIPVDSSYNDKTLYAYYLNDDGSIEKHEVVIKDDYASFETNHFSIYTLGEAIVEETNPKTLDNILVYVFILTLSIFSTLVIKRFLRN